MTKRLYLECVKILLSRMDNNSKLRAIMVVFSHYNTPLANSLLYYDKLQNEADYIDCQISTGKTQITFNNFGG